VTPFDGMDFGVPVSESVSLPTSDDGTFCIPPDC